MNKTLRLFIAVELPEKLTMRLSLIQSSIAHMRWNKRLHLTLRFLGDKTEEQFEEIQEALTAAEEKPFSLTIKGTGVFVREDGVILWAGVEPSDGLLSLKKGIDKALRQAGLFPEKKFTPHITLGRGRNPGHEALKTFVEQAEALEEEFLVSHFTLFKSILQPGGAKHITLADYELI